MSTRATFIRDPRIALFLDVDGTLLEIAATPSQVRVPASLRNTLQLLAARERGAVALMSGRSLAELDELFAPCRLAASGKHGLEVRLPSGKVIQRRVDPAKLDGARRRLGQVAAGEPGLLLEDKAEALAVHFRLAPHLEARVTHLIDELAAALGDEFAARHGKCVAELAPRAVDESSAIELLMRQPEFAGRVPVFVGDDPNDELAFETVNGMGGHSIRVGKLERTAARYRFSNVSTVVAWLRDLNLSR